LFYTCICVYIPLGSLVGGSGLVVEGWRTPLLVALPLVGLAASLAALLGGGGVCWEGSGCSRVVWAPEARLPGGLHVSQLAPAYFALLALVTASYFLGLHGPRPVVLLYYAGAAVVPVLVALEAWIGAFCPYCTVMQACILVGALACRGLRA